MDSRQTSTRPRLRLRPNSRHRHHHSRLSQANDIEPIAVLRAVDNQGWRLELGSNLITTTRLVGNKLPTNGRSCDQNTTYHPMEYSHHYTPLEAGVRQLLDDDRQRSTVAHHTVGRRSLNRHEPTARRYTRQSWTDSQSLPPQQEPAR